MITKSDFLKFKQCPSSFWFHKNKPEVLAEEKIDPFVDRLKRQGYEVELFARNLFKEGVLVEGKLAKAVAQTNSFLDQGAKEIFQASFSADELFASCDVLVWNDLFQGWDIIEIKSSTSKDRKKSEHILDAAFQRILAQKAGLKVVNVYLIELNKEFLKKGDINPSDLFKQTEITTECIDLEQELLADIQHAKDVLAHSEPTSCPCNHKGRSSHCRAFNYLYPNVPEYSVYDLRAIGNSKKKLAELVDAGHIALESIPDDFKLNKTHEKQLEVYKSKETIIDHEAIRNNFMNLEYPLYFLDYETLACGIPKFETTFPYQQTVFQYSLHILHEDGAIEHKEFIHRDQSTPVHIVAQKLREVIGDKGNVVVWNKGFEGKCNADLAAVNSGLSTFLLDLNARIFDLMLVFKQMEYVHDGFKGSYSIKNVLPIICPELNYDILEVSNGAQAVVEYEGLIFGTIQKEEQEKKFNDLLAYCKLDTWAMVRIFQELKKVVKQG